MSIVSEALREFIENKEKEEEIISINACVNYDNEETISNEQINDYD